MRELRNCDFCDADAVGAFEIVPPELEPTEAEQRRVVCCPDCKERLETLIEPLLARAGADGKGPENGTDEATATRETDGSGSVVATADESTENRSRTASPSASVSDPTDGADAEDGAASDSEPGSTTESVLEDGITFERDERADESGAEPDSTTDAGATSDSADAVDADDRPEPNDAPTESSTDPSAGSPSRPPAAYNKVVRLLRNREFPMKRSAVEELAAGAYELESHEVEAIVDHAIEDGEFVEENGRLRRP
ncbi:hypothetical protein [Natrinema salsiterrestre]|uniref:Uncharacterized protein n=1 Tax=Natrinema salsiterrestre TaxID=2950540 RepID=A0A9Q4L494_9EURY|nr:hypothetical protein [Natrinema salsiterrestre]MDF9747337.1 hypothetical protein [Natrinema salsiterrestre]